MTTTLRLFKGKTWGTCEIRDEFASLLVGIEQARPDCHRFLFGELETRTDPDDSDNEARVVARWIFTTEFLLQLLDIIPHYLNLCERGEFGGRGRRTRRRGIQRQGNRVQAANADSPIEASEIAAARAEHHLRADTPRSVAQRPSLIGNAQPDCGGLAVREVDLGLAIPRPMRTGSLRAKPAISVYGPSSSLGDAT